jgi:beta-phosphoglucomutase-like phosphatase (HAD superfamily)
MITKRQLDAVLFDLDGVITKMACVHRLAWRHLWRQFDLRLGPGQSQLIELE